MNKKIALIFMMILVVGVVSVGFVVGQLSDPLDDKIAREEQAATDDLFGNNAQQFGNVLDGDNVQQFGDLYIPTSNSRDQPKQLTPQQIERRDNQIIEIIGSGGIIPIGKKVYEKKWVQKSFLGRGKELWVSGGEELTDKELYDKIQGALKEDSNALSQIRQGSYFDEDGNLVTNRNALSSQFGGRRINPLTYNSYLSRGISRRGFNSGFGFSQFGYGRRGRNAKAEMFAGMLMQYKEDDEDSWKRMLPYAAALSGQIGEEQLEGIMTGVSLGEQGVPKHEATAHLVMSSLNPDGSMNWGTFAMSSAMYALTYKKTSQEIIRFSCDSWEAPVAGNDCELCNDEVMPCSEYQCRSLGQACKLENAGTDEAICYWAHRSDAKPPVIKPWQDVLEEGYKYEEISDGEERGFRIINGNSDDGCVPAFDPLRFGVQADEPARCKIDYLRQQTFDDMEFDFGGSATFKYNHSEILKLPSPNDIVDPGAQIHVDGNYKLYTRCSDPNGNYNVKNIVFEFCVDDGPDTTAPLIAQTSLLNGMPVTFGKKNINLDIFVNEFADCRWTMDETKEYEDMENTFDCPDREIEINTMMLYKCSTILSGIKDREQNNYYFRCQDKTGNANRESYEFTIFGTQPLVIDSVAPDNETIKDSTDTIKVTLEAETSAGYSEGRATCFFAENDVNEEYLMFYYDGIELASYQHAQSLWLSEGNYTYYIKCMDAGGNQDKAVINFNVEIDSEAPIVVRTYKEDERLKIITNEEAQCVYGIGEEECNYLFEDGIPMTELNGIEHFIQWDTENNYYIKCNDEYGNQPLSPVDCSIVVRPFGFRKKG